MIVINDKSNCCGCEACIQKCPKDCIVITCDNEGFRYPKVDTALCVDCHLCERVCPIITPATKTDALSIVAAINPDEQDRAFSSSGGVFIHIAKKTLNRGGVVFGARFSQDFSRVYHTAAQSYEELLPLLGSKYTQSEIGNTYVETRTFLQSGRCVLFAGTPCQIAGLRNFLGRNYPELFTIDILCHGVPSPKVWSAHLQQLIARQCDKKIQFSSPRLKPQSDILLENVSFRDKSSGWKKYSFHLRGSATNGRGEKIQFSLLKPFFQEPFMQGFLADLYLRPSCYECTYRTGGNCSDLTIGDFWGFNSIAPDLDDDRGTSLVMANTPAGLQALNGLKILTDVTPQQMDVARTCNGGLKHIAIPHPKRAKFFRMLPKARNIDALIIDILHTPLTHRIKGLLKRIWLSIAMH